MGPGTPGAGPGVGAPSQAGVQCSLDSARDLAALLQAVQLKEKEKNEQKATVHLEASTRGLKLASQSPAKDVAVLAWMFSDAFREYRYAAPEEVHLRVPMMPLLSCLQIFGDRASLALRYPDGDDQSEIRLTIEEDGAVTECQLRTLVMDEAEPLASFFAPGDSASVFRPLQAEAWHQALSEFSELEMPDTVLQLTVCDGPQAVVLRAVTVLSDAEVVLPRQSIGDLQLIEGASEVSYRYRLSSVLASCFRASKDAKAVKVRFNAEGVMSNQFILRSRGSRDLFVESLVCPLADTADGDDLGGLPPYGGSQSQIYTQPKRARVSGSSDF